MGYHWEHWDKHREGVPHDAVEGGRDSDGSTIYVGRAQHNGHVLPAKVIPSKHYTSVPDEGGEHSVEHFEVLVGHNLHWTHAEHGHIPPGAVEGGHDSHGELYIGRAHHKGSLTVGKVSKHHGVVKIPFEHDEHSYHEYEVLVDHDHHDHHHH